MSCVLLDIVLKIVKSYSGDNENLIIDKLIEMIVKDMNVVRSKILLLQMIMGEINHLLYRSDVSPIIEAISISILLFKDE